MGQSKYIEKIENLVALLPNYHNVLEGNEAQTRWLLIDPFILDCWGYSREDIIVEYSIDKEERVSKYDALDYCIVLNNKPKLLVEAKSLGVDLYSKVQQLSDYFRAVYLSSTYMQRELIGVLTDGDLYLFFTDSKEQGVMDTEPFYTVRLSLAETEEIENVLNYSKEYLLINSMPNVNNDEEYDLNEYYRIDMVERVFNYFESLGLELCIDSAYIRGRYKKIKSLRTLYREILKEINILQPTILYELAIKEDSIKVDGSISECMISLNEIQEGVKINTNQGVVNISFSRTRKGMIDRIVWILKHSSIGLVNVSVRLNKR